LAPATGWRCCCHDVDVDADVDVDVDVVVVVGYDALDGRARAGIVGATGECGADGVVYGEARKVLANECGCEYGDGAATAPSECEWPSGAACVGVALPSGAPFEGEVLVLSWNLLRAGCDAGNALDGGGGVGRVGAA